MLWSSPSYGEEAGNAIELPLPRSIEVRVSGAYVRTSASPHGSRRGTLAYGARIRPLESVKAGGCERPWYRIGDEAWVCGESVARRGTEPDAPQLPVVEEGQVVPHSYGFAGADGARVYKTLEDAEYEEWDREHDPSSGLHIRSKVKHRGRAFFRLVKGGYVPVGDVRPANPSSFEGIHLEQGRLAGWTGKRPVIVRPGPGRGKVLRRLGKRSGIPIFEKSKVGRALWLRIAEGEWVPGKSIRLVAPVEPPPSVGATERWVHVDRTRQILTAYQGKRPVFATLVSTGRRGATTPAGIFRIWAKLATTVMDDEGDTIDERPYTMQGVPWVMFFNEGVALHGAYWHNNFGRIRSHGCVNLAPQDAAEIFQFTSPTLPPGWTGVLPTRSDPGTIVVVQ